VGIGILAVSDFSLNENGPVTRPPPDFREFASGQESNERSVEESNEKSKGEQRTEKFSASSTRNPLAGRVLGGEDGKSESQETDTVGTKTPTHNIFFGTRTIGPCSGRMMCRRSTNRLLTSRLTSPNTSKAGKGLKGRVIGSEDEVKSTTKRVIKRGTKRTTRDIPFETRTNQSCADAEKCRRTTNNRLMTSRMTSSSGKSRSKHAKTRTTPLEDTESNDNPTSIQDSGENGMEKSKKSKRRSTTRATSTSLGRKRLSGRTTGKHKSRPKNYVGGEEEKSTPFLVPTNDDAHIRKFNYNAESDFN